MLNFDNLSWKRDEMVVRKNDIAILVNEIVIRVNRMAKSSLGIWALVNDFVGLVVEVAESVNGGVVRVN